MGARPPRLALVGHFRSGGWVANPGQAQHVAATPPNSKTIPMMWTNSTNGPGSVSSVNAAENHVEHIQGLPSPGVPLLVSTICRAGETVCEPHTTTVYTRPDCDSDTPD